MISCTEFIPAYSELFSFLDERYGRDEVDRLWYFLFKPDGKGIPLINFIEKEGIRGCFTYWSGTLSEEASDCELYLNEKAGWYLSKMHHCPSKGRLLELKEKIGITPYYDYCLHCACYDSALEKVGLKRYKIYPKANETACSSLIFDPKVFKGGVVFDENTETRVFKSSEQEYFHPDFHSSMNMGLLYVGQTHGTKVVRDYLTRYVKNVYAKVIADAKLRGLAPIEELIRETYRLEKAEDALTIENDGTRMTVTVSYCPAVRHLHATGREVCEWFVLSTEAVMQTIASEAGLGFKMLSYDAESGAAKYAFTKE
jgi:hypothetical protein